MKTLAIRLEDDLHAQLSLVSTLEGQTVTEIIRTAILTYIQERKASLSGKADQALAEIEREAAARRQAIASLFGEGSDNSEAESPAESEAPNVDQEPEPGSGRQPRRGRQS